MSHPGEPDFSKRYIKVVLMGLGNYRFVEGMWSYWFKELWKVLRKKCLGSLFMDDENDPKFERIWKEVEENGRKIKHDDQNGCKR